MGVTGRSGRVRGLNSDRESGRKRMQLNLARAWSTRAQGTEGGGVAGGMQSVRA